MKEFSIFARDVLFDMLQRKARESSKAAAEKTAVDAGPASVACQLIREYVEEKNVRCSTYVPGQGLMHLFVDMRGFYCRNHPIIVPGNSYQVVFLNWFDEHVAELAALICDISPTDAAAVQHNYQRWLSTTR